jgi:hypothetical protein
LSKDRASEAGALAATVARDSALDEAAAKRKWLHATMQTLHDRRSEFADPVAVIESLFAGFD